VARVGAARQVGLENQIGQIARGDNRARRHCETAGLTIPSCHVEEIRC
jgi:hypothetical protein